jgi:hypothetical protein
MFDVSVVMKRWAADKAACHVLLPRKVSASGTRRPVRASFEPRSTRHRSGLRVFPPLVRASSRRGECEDMTATFGRDAPSAEAMRHSRCCGGD